MPAKETIRVRAQRELDRFNDPVGPVRPWRTIPGAIVVPRESQDYEQRGAVVIKGFMIAVGGQNVVNDTDEVEVRGEIHQIDGAVGDYGRRKLFYTMRAN